MINLRNDYSCVGHHKILEKLCKYASEENAGYGLDKHSKRAEELIKEKICKSDAFVYFLTGGTITNKVLISHALKSYEAVVCVDSGHINVHETGTIEQGGHKVISVPHLNGKLTLEKLDEVIKYHDNFHMVNPKMVYITNATEFGTLYTKDELTSLYTYCKEHDLYLFLDGARLGVALASEVNDISFSDYAANTDAFYIGGTKNGSLLGEALVICNKALNEEIRFSIKHYGGLYSKGFVAGMCFEALFEDDLFLEIAREENRLAKKLKDGLTCLGISFEIDSSTNQIFPIFKNKDLEKLKSLIDYEVWNKGKDYTTIRFVTSFITTDEVIDSALGVIRGVLRGN